MTTDAEPLGLQWLLTSPCEDFFASAWEREVLLRPGAITESVQRLLTIDQFESSMAGSPAGRSGWLNVVEDGVARPLLSEDGSAVRLAPLYEAFLRGSTFLQTQVQLRCPPVAALCRSVENDLLDHGLLPTEGVSANAYLSPARSRGFDIHYDNHCVLVIQLHGRKSWEVFAPTDELPLRRCCEHISRESLAEPCLQTTLEPGDVLYIPRGFPHVARTGDSSSLHLTLSLRTATWADALSELCRTRVELRRSLPPVHQDGAGLRDLLATALLPALAGLDVDRLIRGRIRERAAALDPLPSGLLRAIDDSAGVDAFTPLCRAPTIRCTSGEEDGQAVLRFPGATLRLHRAMTPVFDFVAGNRRFTASQLPKIDAHYDPVELARILVQRGLLRLQHPPQPGPQS